MVEKNCAFIDGQNLWMGTSNINENGEILKKSWIDLKRFRVYLKEKYKVKKAYYFFGVVDENNNDLYEEIQSAGFILVFRKHNTSMVGKKKGNVDVDIVFSIMKKLYKKEIKGKIILVTGDGDYIKLVDFLIKEGLFEKILFPKWENASSLYKGMTSTYFSTLSDYSTKNKIEKKKRET